MVKRYGQDGHCTEFFVIVNFLQTFSSYSPTMIHFSAMETLMHIHLHYAFPQLMLWSLCSAKIDFWHIICQGPWNVIREQCASTPQDRNEHWRTKRDGWRYHPGNLRTASPVPLGVIDVALFASRLMLCLITDTSDRSVASYNASSPLVNFSCLTIMFPLPITGTIWLNSDMTAANKRWEWIHEIENDLHLQNPNISATVDRHQQHSDYLLRVSAKVRSFTLSAHERGFFTSASIFSN